MNCPICSTATDKQRDGTPYYICGSCDVWFQDPMPPKLYHGIHEGIPGVMSEGDRQINRNIAAWLFKDIMGGKRGPIVDIGASLPVLASALADLGCEATVIEGAPVPHEFMNVQQNACDFEKMDERHEYFDLVILVHSYEHMENPVAAMRKIRNMVTPTGHVYIRLPQHDVAGFERDLTPGHYAVHPYYHCLSSMLAIVEQTNTFTITSYLPMAGYGQADFVLAPV